jgi:glycosyltransferase involved in cell wall biosynthesis
MISLLIPCYNEREVLDLTYDAIVDAAGAWKEPIEILFVDDGSSDGTWEIIETLAARDRRVRGIRLSRNFGHQAAVGAGMEQASGDAVVILDADLQDPPSLVGEMIAKWREGYKVVYAQRNARQGESTFKKLTAKLYYRLLDKMTDISIPHDTGDFALLDASIVRLLVGFKEHALFWRGLRCWTGFEQTAVRFDRPARAKGETKYTLRKMMHFAANGLVSFSALPLKLSLYLGGLTLGGTVLATLAAAAAFILNPSAGWPLSATALITLYVGAVQLLCLGVMGEYVNRIYDEVRERPRWLVQQKIGFEQAQARAGIPRRKAG